MPSKTFDYASLAEQIEQITDNPKNIPEPDDEVTRRRLYEGARKLGLFMEEPGDTLRRICYVPLQLSLARVGVETRLFEVLSAAEDATYGHLELASKTDVDPTLMKRLLRYYQSLGMVSQVAEDAYGPSNVTMALGSSAGGSTISYFAEVMAPAAMAVPEYFRRNGYQNPTDSTRCAWNIGHYTDECLFPWVQRRPEYMGYFLPWMNIQREGRPTFFDIIDFTDLARGTTSSTPFFVDIGGAKGTQCIAFKERYPYLPGRVILQDVPQVIEEAKANPLPGFEGIETVAYDFFTQQPVEGARVYYLRNILHDWPNHKCIRILENIKAGMTEDSLILIDEMALPERNVPWRAAQQDMEMMACLAATERSGYEWQHLVSRAGLKVQSIRNYTEDYDSIILVTLR